MFRRLFGRAAPPQPDTAAWWREADALAASADPERIAAGIAALRARMTPPEQSPDIAESQAEMIDALERLVALLGAPALPVVVTQHRVIAQAPCHFLTPASLVDQVDASGKLFATAERLVFAAGAVRQWPWHTISAITRQERDVVIDLRGRPAAARLRTNTYGDALVLVALAGRLGANRP